jgi:hypothetical protein
MNNTLFLEEIKNDITITNIIKYIENVDEKIFLAKVYVNDINYVKKFCNKIKNYEIKSKSILIAAQYSTVAMIELIINRFKYEKVDRIYNCEYNCLLLACKHNNLDVVKYLIEVVQMDTNRLADNFNRDNCLEIACRYNDLNVVKYLVEDAKITMNNYCGNKFACICGSYSPGMIPACDEIIKYLIENTNVTLR